MTTETMLAAGGVGLSIAAGVGTLVWNAARIVSSTDRNSDATARLSTSVDGLATVVAVQHERLDNHEKRLEDHHGRIRDLERQ